MRCDSSLEFTTVFNQKPEIYQNLLADILFANRSRAKWRTWSTKICGKWMENEYDRSSLAVRTTTRTRLLMEDGLDLQPLMVFTIW